MAVFQLNPSDGLRNMATYETTPASEARTRAIFQDPIDQVVVELNKKVALADTTASFLGDAATASGKHFACGQMSVSSLPCTTPYGTGMFYGNVLVTFGQTIPLTAVILANVIMAGVGSAQIRVQTTTGCTVAVINGVSATLTSLTVNWMAIW